MWTRTVISLAVLILLTLARIVQAKLAHRTLPRLLNDLATLSGDGRDA